MRTNRKAWKSPHLLFVCARSIVSCACNTRRRWRIVRGGAHRSVDAPTGHGPVLGESENSKLTEPFGPCGRAASGMTGDASHATHTDGFVA
jgi:hypothetical protein